MIRREDTQEDEQETIHFIWYIRISSTTEEKFDNGRMPIATGAY